MSEDPYAALGVEKHATHDEVKKAYKRIAKESHPDLNPGDPTAATRFKRAAAAYDLLKDPDKRARFDRGEIDAAGQDRPVRRFYREYAEGPEATYHTTRGFEDFSDVFADLFNRRPRGTSTGEAFQTRGPDQHYTLEVSFLEAVNGATRRITLPGRGELEVKIPEGLADGQTIRLRGKGGRGFEGGPAGDALITVGVRPHPFFRREGDDIVTVLPITFDEAVLGAKIEVPTIVGRVVLSVPKGASSGQVLRLRGRGVRRGDKKGDQRVELKIVSPEKIDPELEDFFRTWREHNRYDPRKGVKA